MRAADRALYAAKRLGRDRCVLYEAETIALLGRPARRRHRPARRRMLLAETLDLRDAGTARHSQTVGPYAGDRRELGLAGDRVERVRAAGVLHDIGKIGIADAILHKPGPLDDREWAEMRRHPELGARILEHANLPDIADWVLPTTSASTAAATRTGLAGEADPARGADPLGRRRLRGDDRRPPLPRGAPARDRARGAARGAGTQFDPDVVDALRPCSTARGAHPVATLGATTPAADRGGRSLPS